jgi:hypothetical protein
MLGCGGHASPPSPAPGTQRVPAELLGRFEDDYGDRFVISDTEWLQQPHGRLRIHRWAADSGFLIAQNDSSNRYDPGRWTRIDWVTLPAMAPYTWAFCLSAYKAPTADSAAATRIADRSHPRTGCNGHPFSRMKRSVDHAP